MPAKRKIPTSKPQTNKRSKPDSNANATQKTSPNNDAVLDLKSQSGTDEKNVDFGAILLNQEAVDSEQLFAAIRYFESKKIKNITLAHHCYNLLLHCIEDLTNVSLDLTQLAKLQRFINFLHKNVVPKYEKHDCVGDTHKKISSLQSLVFKKTLEHFDNQLKKSGVTDLKLLYQNEFNALYECLKYFEPLQRNTNKNINNKDVKVFAELFKRFLHISHALFELCKLAPTSSLTAALQFKVHASYKPYALKTKQILNLLNNLTVPHSTSDAARLFPTNIYKEIIQTVPVSFRDYIIHHNTQSTFDEKRLMATPPTMQPVGLPIFTIPELFISGQNNTYEQPARVSLLPSFIKAKQSSVIVIDNSTLPAIVDAAHKPTHSKYLDAVTRLTGISGTPAAIDVPYQKLDDGDFYGETLIDPTSNNAVKNSVHACLAAAAYVSDAKNATEAAICLTRPPGHHAGYNSSHGFCFFNNVFITAYQLHQQGYKVLIVDFDLHSADGTEELQRHHKLPGIYVVNFHKEKIFPHTCCNVKVVADEKILESNIIRCPLPAGCKTEEFKSSYTKTLAKLPTTFYPDYVIYSAGFDGHRLEKIESSNGWQLTASDYAWAVEQAPAKYSSPRIKSIAILEGGYNAKAIAECIPAMTHALEKLNPPLKPSAAVASTDTAAASAAVASAAAPKATIVASTATAANVGVATAKKSRFFPDKPKQPTTKLPTSQQTKYLPAKPLNL